MTIQLRDIIDLDFFLKLDEDSGRENEDALSERDRDIFNQMASKEASDAELLTQWLYFRKLLFFHTASPQEILPGTLFNSLWRWAARGLLMLGLVLGLVAAYSFLAYHGSSPVNVTLFITFFILIQALVSLSAVTVMARRWLQEKTGRTHKNACLFQALFSSFFFRRLGRVFEKAWDLPHGKSLKSIRDKGIMAHNIHQNHKKVMFWPFFILTSLFAFGVSSGALCGTLFRVAVTDLAFGWQSTLVSSAAQVHGIVSWMALPWSWLLPQDLAAPSLAQIEGSRIFLKEGIGHLSTGDLTAWWPFLCLGMLVYGVVFRGLILAGAWTFQQLSLTAFDTGHPRYKRLLVRMRSPRMETRPQPTPVSEALNRSPLPRPKDPEFKETGPKHPDPDVSALDTPLDDAQSPGTGNQDAPPLESEFARSQTLGLLFAPDQAYPREIRDIMAGLIQTQLDVTIPVAQGLTFDFDQDKAVLEAAAKAHGKGPVIFLQEVWQPPIRGLLYYYSQVKSQVFPHHPLWIILTQAPGEDEVGVDGDDMDFKVWKAAVDQLETKGIALERIRP